MFTDETYAVADAVKNQDAVHKAPAYAAKLLEKRF